MFQADQRPAGAGISINWDAARNEETISDEPSNVTNDNWAVGKYRQYFGASAKTQDAVTELYPELADHIIR